MAAFSAHAAGRPLALGPDAIWITVAQGLARHLRRAPDSQPTRTTIDARRKEISSLGDAWWDHVISGIAAQIIVQSPSLAQLATCEFSTTGPLERTVGALVLAEAMGPDAPADLDPGGDIPAITLEGAPEDWARIQEKVTKFAAEVPGSWAERLLPRCEALVRVAQGKARLAGSIQGWIAPFLPCPGARGLSRIEVTLAFTSAIRVDIALSAGLLGIAQDPSTGAFSLAHGWELDGTTDWDRACLRLFTGPNVLRQPSRRRGPTSNLDGDLRRLYDLIDGAEIHAPSGETTYRILPLAEMREVEIDGPWIKFCVWCGGSGIADEDIFFAARRSSAGGGGEIAFLSSRSIEEVKAGRARPRVVAPSVAMFLERALDWGMHPWFMEISRITPA